MRSDHGERLARARCSLEGLSVGDAFGRQLELAPPHNAAQWVSGRVLQKTPWRFTDDTNMALSIMEILRRHGGIEQDQLALSFADHYDRSRGYGSGARALLAKIREGEPWREVSARLFGGGSYGNGGAMRVAPVGGYFAEDLNATAEQARRSAEVTHAHPEGIAGAIAVAVAAAVAWQFGHTRLRPSREEFIDRILPHIPDSEVREKSRHARDLGPGASVRLAVSALGNGSRISAQDTVPFCLWCVAERLDNYEEALWLTASGGGDVDTNCAIVGGIVSLYTSVEGIPAEWIASREPLPNWPFHEE
jgi:ADP-ribosylglycohydrolase